ncbi:hypothetical protein [Pedobacter alluvionis]|uniref:Uncharacterized protein n=1 Tax=Pedobacter alluvionis TaxID=475253 RepID=A0A497Y5E4_9SPHI|nr:hypothetical protein [Pedobacter alluvionis]RLJ77005.1 hypothetical protein BCL90_2065 [Pedobacter alluvionis]
MNNIIKKNAKALSTVIAIVLLVFVLGEITESFGRSFAKDFNISIKK